MKCLTVTFALFLGGVVLAADFGAARSVFHAMGLIPLGDKLAHFLLVGIMSLLLNLTFSGATVQLPWGRVLLGSLILMGAVTLEEISQLFLPHRSFEIADLAFNYAGIFSFGWLALRLIDSSRPNTDSESPLAEVSSSAAP